MKAEQPSSSPNNKSQTVLIKLATLLESSSHTELTHNQFTRLIWDKVGTTIPDSVIDTIFTECDTDQNGFVSIEEIYKYIDAVNEGSRIQKIGYVIKNVSFSVTFWAWVIFALASFVGMAFNILWRIHDEEDSSFNYDFFNNILYVFGSYAFVGEIYDKYMRDLNLVETAKRKIFIYIQKAELSVDADHEMESHELFSVLEQHGLFLPARTFMVLFNDMDEDNNGKISISEINKYAMDREFRPAISAVIFHWTVLKKCFGDIDYWLQWGWTVASVMNVMTSYNETWSENFVWHFDGTSYVIFLICASLQHRLNYQSVAETIHQTEELKRILLHRVIDIASSELTDLTRLEICSSFAKKGEDARIACEAFFQHVDVNCGKGGPDEELDFVEVYDALDKAGFVLDKQILRSIFDQADTSGDGKLQMEEFVKYILSIEGEQDAAGQRWHILQVYMRDIQFIMANFEVLASIFLLPGNYVSSAWSSMNWYLASDVGWLIPAIYESYALMATAASDYDVYIYSAMNFKTTLFEAIIKSESTSTTLHDDGTHSDSESKYGLTLERINV